MGSGIAWQPDGARARAPKDGEWRRTGCLAVEATLLAVVASVVAVVVVVVIVAAAVAAATAAAPYHSTGTTSSHTKSLSRQNQSRGLAAAPPCVMELVQEEERAMARGGRAHGGTCCHSCSPEKSQRPSRRRYRCGHHRHRCRRGAPQWARSLSPL